MNSEHFGRNKILLSSGKLNNKRFDFWRFCKQILRFHLNLKVDIYKITYEKLLLIQTV